MTEILKHKETIKLAKQFREAAYNYLLRNPNEAKKLSATFSEDELNEGMRLGTELQLLNQSKKFERIPELAERFKDTSKKALAKELEVAEFGARLYPRTLDKDIIQSFIPDDLKTDDTIQTLENLGAKSLARLCKNAM